MVRVRKCFHLLALFCYIITQVKTQAKILLSVAMLFSAGNSVAATFINVFLMRSTHNSIDLVIWQNILNYFVLLVAFVSGSFLLSKISISVIFRIGIATNVLYYLIILVLQSNLLSFVIPLGIFSGLGSGLYWFSLNLLIGNLVDSNNRPRFFSLQQMMAFAFGIVIPALSGWLIVKMSGLTGYYVLFGLAIVLLGVGILMVGKLENFKADQKMNVLKILKVKKNPFWNANIMLNISMGFKGVLNSLVFILFAYLLFNNESVIGNLTSLQATLSVISSFVFAKLFLTKYTRKLYFLISFFSFIAYLFLAIFASPIMLIIAFVIFGITQSWGSAIANSMNYQFSEFGARGFTRDEYIVASEFPMAFGRIGGLLIVFLLEQVLSSIELTYRIVFILIGSMWLVEFFMIDHGVGWKSEEFVRTKIEIKS